MARRNQKIEQTPVVIVLNVAEYEATMNTIIALKNELLRVKGQGADIKDGVVGLGSRAVRSMSDQLKKYQDYFKGVK
ncbi:hypothetical protein SAMN04515674_105322 [Pseudarcicella hirudinis]|uniref:Uncharacterized protein n=1 Tax=Pseudarcicella hirudinis TaxID=1079859 RepID=A0A1I5T1C9_9BACT|nr:hypothetical protein [Pseudarcicella hirudinis]SFP76830.1 hypothetical protein SAMN04515674_105322 [Pseudarcicella hirudinis]